MNSFNSLWYTNNQSKNGVNPPYPSVISSRFTVFSSEKTTDLSSQKIDSQMSSQKTNSQKGFQKGLWTISSPRIPYGVDFLNNGYGSLGMTLGTNWGK